MAVEYDVVINGGGAAGENVAGRTAPGGRRRGVSEAKRGGGAWRARQVRPRGAYLVRMGYEWGKLGIGHHASTKRELRLPYG